MALHVDKQVLRYLGIEKIAIKEAETVHSCIPIFFFQEAWLLYCVTELSLNRGQHTLLMSYRGEPLSAPVHITGVRGKRRHYTVVFIHALPLELQYRLTLLQNHFDTADKRGERRS